MTVRNRPDLKSFFVKNAIPTEGNFADLIDSQLNQAQDGVFKLENEPLSVVAAAGDQKRTLRLYGTYAGAGNPDWIVSLNPTQDPANAASARAGFGITDGAGRARLFIEAGTGRVGIGTNTPQAPLEVAGEVRANGLRGRNELVLNDYRTVNPTSNVCLHSPGNDRDAWIYRDAADATSNWGLYHRQINGPVGGLPQNSIAFVGGGASKLQAYVALGDGSAFFAGKLNAAGYGPTTAGVNAGTMEIGGQDPATNGARGGVLYLHDHNRIAHQLRYNNGTLYLEAAGNGYGTSARPALALGGDILLEGKLALRGNDAYLRLNQDSLFTSGVHTPQTFTAGRIGINNWTPAAALEVNADTQTWGGWLEAIRFNRPEHSAITHPGGKLLFGMHSDRSFYFADTAAGRYVMTISAASGIVSAPSGVKGGEIGIASQQHGATAYPYETIQMNPAHNLRVVFGTTQRFMFGNDGSLRIQFANGFWVFQTDGNLVKYRNNGTAAWVSGAGW